MNTRLAKSAWRPQPKDHTIFLSLGAAQAEDGMWRAAATGWPHVLHAVSTRGMPQIYQGVPRTEREGVL